MDPKAIVTPSLAYQPGVGLVPRAPFVRPAVIVGPPTPDGLRAMVANYFNSLTPSTRRTYEWNIGTYAKFSGHESSAAAIGALVAGGPGDAFAALTQWKMDLIEKGYAPSTINLALMSVRSLLSFVADCGLIHWRVKVRPVKAAQKDMRGPGREGVAKLFAVRTDATPMALRDRAMVRMLFSAALRRAEVSSLNIEHIDLTRGSISVLRKGWTTRQTLSVSPNVVRDLAAWISVRGPEAGPLFFNFDTSGKGGKRLTGNGIYKVLRRVASDAGLDPKKVRPHGMRHAGITTALDATHGNIRSVMRFSGHTKPEMVLRYDDSRQDFARQVATAVDSWENLPDNAASNPDPMDYMPSDGSNASKTPR